MIKYLTIQCNKHSASSVALLVDSALINNAHQIGTRIEKTMTKIELFLTW